MDFRITDEPVYEFSEMMGDSEQGTRPELGNDADEIHETSSE